MSSQRFPHGCGRVCQNITASWAKGHASMSSVHGVSRAVVHYTFITELVDENRNMNMGFRSVHDVRMVVGKPIITH
jgi:hypothetical protein